MAKREQTRKKAPAPEPREISPFWLLTGAVLLFVVALFLLLGGFGTGGPLPKALFNGGYSAFGWAAWLLPVVLVYWGVYKFSVENHRMPLLRLASLLFTVLFASGWLFTLAAEKHADGTFTNGHGGAVGNLLGGMVLSALDKFPASILFIVFMMLSIFFAFGISPLVLKNLGKLFTRPQSGDTDLGDLKAKA